MSEWKPIESAPKDGTWIVAVGTLNNPSCPDFRGRPRACVTAYFDASKYENSPAFAVGWFYSSPGYSDIFHPTHWMPLPHPERPETNA